MEWLVVLVIIIIILTFFLPKSADVVDGYRLRGELLTPAERSFYGVLLQVLPEDLTLFCKVRIADVILPQKGMSRQEWQRSFNQISAKHFDFVLCQKTNMRVVAAIELDDASHNKKTTQKRDAFVNIACESAELKLIRFKAQRAYQLEDVKTRLIDDLETLGEDLSPS